MLYWWKNHRYEADVKLSIDAHGFYKYTFRNTCQEDKDLVLDDGVTKVVLNAAGQKGDITQELKEFLQLVAGNVDPTITRKARLLIACRGRCI